MALSAGPLVSLPWACAAGMPGALHVWVLIPQEVRFTIFIIHFIGMHHGCHELSLLPTYLFHIYKACQICLSPST